MQGLWVESAAKRKIYVHQQANVGIATILRVWKIYYFLAQGWYVGNAIRI